MTDDEKIAILKAASKTAQASATGTPTQRKRAWWLAVWKAVESVLQDQSPRSGGDGS